MRVETDEPCPLPDDPVLAGVAAAIDTAGHWAWILVPTATDKARRDAPAIAVCGL